MGLGARGVSLVFSAGNGGVAGYQDQKCTQFVPTFPSSCPLYVNSSPVFLCLLITLRLTIRPKRHLSRFNNRYYGNCFILQFWRFLELLYHTEVPKQRGLVVRTRPWNHKQRFIQSTWPCLSGRVYTRRKLRVCS